MMRRAKCLLAALLLTTTCGANSASAREYDGLPPGEGRVEVFAWCTACHSAQIIIQQGLSRANWDETLVWMVEEQGMQEPDTEMRRKILDYLSKQFPPERPHYKVDGK